MSPKTRIGKFTDDPTRSYTLKVFGIIAWIMTIVIGLMVVFLCLKTLPITLPGAWQLCIGTECQVCTQAANASIVSDSSQANILTAISLVIGVVALLLTIGTSWFAERQKELDVLIQKQKQENAAIETNIQYHHQLTLGLLKAQAELLDWLTKELSSLSEATYLVMRIGIAFRLMQSVHEPVRHSGWKAIAQDFGPAQHLPITRKYCELVKQHLIREYAKQGDEIAEAELKFWSVFE